MALIDREKNYKINASRVRSYFMSSNSGGPLKLAYENEAIQRPHTVPYDWVAIHPRCPRETEKAYCWIYCDAMTNRTCVELVPFGRPAVHLPWDVPKEVTYGGIEGTIIHGTYNCTAGIFTIGDIFYYRGKHVTYATWGEKLAMYRELFERWKLPAAHFRLPYMMTRAEYQAKADTLAAPLVVQFFKEHSKKSSLIWQCRAGAGASTSTRAGAGTNKQQTTHYNKPRFARFWTKADVRDDIYHLYRKKEARPEDKVALAHIQNLKTSVRMNAIFRNIKENRRLDALEESDDEEDFENIEPNRYLLNAGDGTGLIIKELLYEWQPRFQKWQPADTNVCD